MADEDNKPVKTVALLSRAPGMSFQQFDDYWRNVHAPLAAKLPGVTKYTQRHVIPSTPGGEPENEFGIDGLAVLEYENAAAIETAWSSEAGIAALADVPNFLGKHFVIVLEDYDVV